MKFFFSVGAFAAALALTACAGPSTPQGVAVPGVASVPLTSPWKELNLPIDGGVVEISTANTLAVRFPATPLDAISGLGLDVQDSLTRHGWTVVHLEPQTGRYYTEMEAADGVGATVTVRSDRGRPHLSISRDL